MRPHAPRLASARLRLAWLCVAASITACNPERISGPEERARDRLLGDGIRPFFGFEGGQSIGVPGDNGPPDYGFVDTVPLFTVPPGHFFEIVITGTVTASNSGDCTPPQGQTGSWDANGYNGLDLRLNFLSSPSLGGIPRSGSDTITLNKGVVWWGASTALSVYRSGISG